MRTFGAYLVTLALGGTFSGCSSTSKTTLVDGRDAGTLPDGAHASPGSCEALDVVQFQPCEGPCGEPGDPCRGGAGELCARASDGRVLCAIVRSAALECADIEGDQPTGSDCETCAIGTECQSRVSGTVGVYCVNRTPFYVGACPSPQCDGETCQGGVLGAPTYCYSTAPRTSCMAVRLHP